MFLFILQNKNYLLLFAVRIFYQLSKTLERFIIYKELVLSLQSKDFTTMNDYYQVRFDLEPCCEDACDLLAGMLAENAYESFVADETGVTAYVKKEDYAETAVDEVVADFPFGCKIKVSSELIEGRDWNAEWEKNYFQPIVIGDRVVVHSSFHTDIPAAQYDIVIDPKMAFGTGHHSTTSQILTALLEADLKDKSVIDMGTGTGILAILAAMRGAKPVTGIELDGFAYDNAVENVALNGHAEIKIIHGDASALAEVEAADIFIANINRNVILNDMAAYAAKLVPGGMMLLSGFYEGDDAEMIVAEGRKNGLEYLSETSDNRWACVKLIKA